MELKEPTSLRCNTKGLNFSRDCRLVREIVFTELESLAELRPNVDLYSTVSSILRVYSSLRASGFNYKEVEEEYGYVRVAEYLAKERPSIESIDWRNVPPEILEKCLDENMELFVSDELLISLGLKPGDYIEGGRRVVNRETRVPREQKNRYQKERFYSADGKLLRTHYLEWNEQEQVYKRVKLNSVSRVYMTENELEYALELFSPPPSELRRNRLGMWPSFCAGILVKIAKGLSEMRKYYTGSLFVDLIVREGLAEANRIVREATREYIVSKGGEFNEDTSVFWRDGLLYNKTSLEA